MPHNEEEETQEVTPSGPVEIVAFTRSESIKAIAPALLAAQRKLKNPEKNARNPHFGNRYADLGASMDSAKEALNDQDIAILQCFAPAPYVSVGLTTLAIHKSGEYIGGTCLVPLDRDNAQGLGSAATYARRYGVQALCGIVAEDDDDGEAASRSNGPQPGARRPKSSPAAPAKKLSLFGRK
jgi:hypothetical protein